MNEHGFPVRRLGDLLRRGRGISVGVVYPGDHDPRGTPLIKVGDLSGHRISPVPSFRISPEKHLAYRRTALEGGELLLGLVGAVGLCAVVPPSMAGWNTARAVAVLRLADPADADYVRYALLSPPVQHLMRTWSNTTVQATLNLKEIKELPIPYPPTRVRQEIAFVLRAIEDKIELNHRTNETLEAMARALFKQWFVDPSSPRRGWREVRLGEIFDLDRGLSYKGELLTEDGAPMINLGCFQGHGRFEADHVKRYSGETRDRHWVSEGDLVIANTDMTQNRVILGSPAVVPRISGATRCLFSHHVYAARFRGGPDPAKALFCYHALLQDDFRARAAGFATGTTVLALPRDAILDASFVVPPDELIARFYEAVRCGRERLANHREQSSSLAALRDMLLPKLLSGELCVRDVPDVIA